QNLYIHLNPNCLNHIEAENLEIIDDTTIYPPPNEIALQLSHKDLYLGYFDFIRGRVDQLQSGDWLGVSEEGCKNNEGKLVLKFSKSFLGKVKGLNEMGFQMKEAIVYFIVYWKDEEKNLEMKIVLPELKFEKK
nr:hypothetical protein [Chitinophagaceae bacterium]